MSFRIARVTVHTVNTDVARPSDDVVAGFDGLPSSVVADAADGSGSAMDAGIDPLHGRAAVAGTAVTVAAVPGDNLAIHKAITVARPGDVLVVDGDGYTGTAYLGELMCASCRTHDVAGVVVDGAVRDRSEIAEMGYPVYARGLSPAGPFKHDPGSINVTVSCGGVTVDPGDVVVGDGDGVTVVPAADAEAVLERAREKLETEADLRERVENGEYLYDIGGYDERFGELDVRESGDANR